MSITTSQLQALINKRAEAKLNADIRKTIDSIETNRLLMFSRGSRYSPSQNPTTVYWYAGPFITEASGGDSDTPTPRQKMSIRGMFHDGVNSDFILALKASWLPIYILEETELFLQQYDEMRERVAELDGQVQDLDRNKQDKDY